MRRVHVSKVCFLIVFAAAVVLVGNASSAKAQLPQRMDWTGVVNNRVNVVVRGRTARTETVRGIAFPPGRASFRGTSPYFAPRASVEILDGRGRARITQQPTSRNNFTTIVRIDDPRAGADRYRIRVTWGR